MRTLSPELVPLIHHIELAKAGWGDRLAEQLVIAAGLSCQQGLSHPELRQCIEQRYGVRVSGAQLTRAVGGLTSRKAMLEVEPGRFRISESQRGTLDKSSVEAAQLEADARAAFLEILSKHGIEEPTAWVTFKTHCLQPLIAEVGARIYHVLSGEPPSAEQQRHVDNYTNRYPPEQQGALASSADAFLRSSPAAARRFVLQHLYAHLLMTAASLPEKTLERLQARVKASTQLTLIIDTNVLFSLLDLHENPGNDPSCDLLELASRLKGKLSIRVAVLPQTIDEGKRTLLYYKNKLARLDLTAILGRSAMREQHLSGITQRYLQVASRGKARISAEAYFEPYLDGLQAVAKGKGVDLFNESTSKLSTRQDVVDDILGQQARESTKGDRAKPYESIQHDMVLWHCVHDHRRTAEEGPLDAAYWLVTLDFQLLGFDSYKQRQSKAYVPVGVHPTVLVQLLQLWLPRDSTIDEAMLNSLRPLLPHDFDTDAEEVTLKILASLSRYENVDDLGEDTIAAILMNQALRGRLLTEKDVERQTELVRDTIIEQVERAKQELEYAKRERETIDASLREERSARGRLEEDLKARQALVEEQNRVALESSNAASTLQDRVRALEDTLNRERLQREVANQELMRSRFASWAAAGLFGGLAVVAGLAYWAAVSQDYPIGRSVLTAIAVDLGAWLQLVHYRGMNSASVRNWPLFATFSRWRGWMWAAVGAVLLGVVGNWISDYLKVHGWW